jgi:hypothetical protein
VETAYRRRRGGDRRLDRGKWKWLEIGDWRLDREEMEVISPWDADSCGPLAFHLTSVPPLAPLWIGRGLGASDGKVVCAG